MSLAIALAMAASASTPAPKVCLHAGDQACFRVGKHGGLTLGKGDGTDREIALPNEPADADRQIWPHLITHANGGERAIGVLYDQRTMYSGGGANSTSLRLYRIGDAQGQRPAELMLDLPMDASKLIRACFSETDMRLRRGACHDEYGFHVTLKADPVRHGGWPDLLYRSVATDFPAGADLDADSSGRRLRARDIRTVKNPACSVVRRFRYDPAARRYRPDRPLPDCANYTEL